jgi:hypothetical protein
MSGRDPSGPSSTRYARKALPLDPRGIHWGLGERHESGTPWEPDEWKRFMTWALENGAHCATTRFDAPFVYWDENSYLHRDNGPARLWPDGNEEWWLNGQQHREDGPAVVWTDGYKAWFLNGQRHRENGPALIFSNGYKEWWLNGQKRSQ